MVPPGLRTSLGRLAFLLACLVSGALAIYPLGDWAAAALHPNHHTFPITALPPAIAAGLWLATSRSRNTTLKRALRELALAWLLFGEMVWLATGYFQNLGWLFFAILALIFLTLLGSKRLIEFGTCGKLAVNTVVLLVVATPLIDIPARIGLSPLSGARVSSGPGRIGWRPPTITAANASHFYSYDEAHGDPGAFSEWWIFIASTFEEAGRTGFYKLYPGRNPPHRLRPNGRGTVMDSVVSINSRGFRGPEIAEPKGDIYRIVCLGESTTFGITLRKEDKPWPELLQEMIMQRLHPARPVEVINAGIPVWNLAENLERLYPEILPLRPDMLISYHGYNGFPMIDSTLPPVFGPAPPPYPKRPLRWLAELEYRHDLKAFIRTFQPDDYQPAPMLPPLQTPYAECYRRLIAFTQTNHIRLALANFSMAIDEHSPQKLVNFYNAFGPGILYARANVNAIHSEIVRRLAGQNPDVIFIDSQPGLNGNHAKFIDVVHLTQAGRQQLAENIFAAIRPQLAIDLPRTIK